MLIQIIIFASSIPFSIVQVITPSSSITTKDVSINLSFDTLHSELFGVTRLVLKQEFIFSSTIQGFLDIKNSFLGKVDLNTPYELEIYHPRYVNTYQAYETFEVIGKVKVIFDKARYVEKNDFSVLGFIVGYDNVSILNGLKRVFYGLLNGSYKCKIKFINGILILWRSASNPESKESKYKDKNAKCKCEKKCTSKINGKYRKIPPNFAVHYKKLFYPAIASYGRFFFMKSIKRLRTLNHILEEPRRSILELLSIPTDNLISINLERDPASHILFIDGDELFISFRGTENKDDALKDLNCEYEEFYGGYAHKGFKEIAEAYCEKYLNSLKEVCISKNIKRVVFIGHSLGGAIAILITVILMQKNVAQEAHMEIGELKIPISAIAFSPPPVLSADFCSSIAYRNITVLVYGSDIVPRLSYGSMLDLKFLSISLSNKNYFYEQANTSLIEEIKLYLKTSNLHPKLYLPGVIYHIIKGCCSLYSEINYQDLGEIIVDSRAFLHHGFGCIVNELDDVLKKGEAV